MLRCQQCYNYPRRHSDSMEVVQIERWMKLAGMHTWQDAIGNVHGELRGVNASPSALLMGSHYDTVKDAGAFDGPLGIVTAVAAVKALVATSPQCMPLNDSTASSFSLTQTGTGDKSPTAASIFSFLSRLATGAPAEVATGAVEEIVTLRDVSPCVGEFLAGVGHKVNVRVVAFTDEEGVRFQSTFLGSRALAGAHTPPILITILLVVSRTTQKIEYRRATKYFRSWT